MRRTPARASGRRRRETRISTPDLQEILRSNQIHWAMHLPQRISAAPPTEVETGGPCTRTDRSHRLRSHADQGGTVHLLRRDVLPKIARAMGGSPHPHAVHDLSSTDRTNKPSNCERQTFGHTGRARRALVGLGVDPGNITLSHQSLSGLGSGHTTSGSELGSLTDCSW
jgi:hypothetical protein